MYVFRLEVQKYPIERIIDSLHFYWLTFQSFRLIGCSQTVVRVATPHSTLTSASVSILDQIPLISLSSCQNIHATLTKEVKSRFVFPSILFKTIGICMPFNIRERLLNTLVSYDVF